MTCSYVNPLAPGASSHVSEYGTGSAQSSASHFVVQQPSTSSVPQWPPPQTVAVHESGAAGQSAAVSQQPAPVDSVVVQVAVDTSHVET
jgi:hypothetical protein